MAFRIARHILSGEIDNRIKGRVTGFLELAGNLGRATLDLRGNCHPDLAGSLLRFRNPSPQVPQTDDPVHALSLEQTGTVGDITASRKIKDLLVTVEEYRAMDEEARASAYRWANCLYLEWFSQRNGRVVIEAVGFDLEIVEGPLWMLDEEEIEKVDAQFQEGMESFFSQLGTALSQQAALHEEDDDPKRPAAEAEMDEEMARMDLLNERILRRMEKEGFDGDTWPRIYEEESARLRQERGEPEPEPLSPSQEFERNLWLVEMEEAAQEVRQEMEAGDWVPPEREDHPLVGECRDFGLVLFHDDKIPRDLPQEHPLAELRQGILCASGKLAGALNSFAEEEGLWPPDSLTAPVTLTFLKKARGYLRDAMLAMDSIDEENLLPPEWREQTRHRLQHLLFSTQTLIDEARRVLGENS